MGKACLSGCVLWLIVLRGRADAGKRTGPGRGSHHPPRISTFAEFWCGPVKLGNWIYDLILSHLQELRLCLSQQDCMRLC